MSTHSPENGASTQRNEALANNLVVAAKVGDTDAYGRLIALYQTEVRRFLVKLTKGNHAFADDLAQDTFVRAHEKISGFRQDAAFSSWLYTIAYRLFLDAVKRDARRSHLLDDHQLLAPENSVSSGDLEANFDIEKALATLKVEQRTAIVLCLQEGLSHTDASVIMALPIGTVKSHIARGRERLKQRLREWNQIVEEAK